MVLDLAILRIVLLSMRKSESYCAARWSGLSAKLIVAFRAVNSDILTPCLRVVFPL